MQLHVMQLYNLYRTRLYLRAKCNSLVYGVGMLDPNFFNNEREKHMDLFTSFPKVIRVIVVIYLFQYFYVKFKHHINFRTTVRWFIWVVICWLALYLCSLVVYFLPPDLPFIFHFMNFAWFANLYPFVKQAEFYELTYLNGLPRVYSVLIWVDAYKIGYATYLGGEVVNLKFGYLDNTVNDLINAGLCLTSFFTVSDWLLLTAMVFFATPTFLFLPESLCPFTSPDINLNYTAYMLKGISLWSAVNVNILKAFMTTNEVSPDTVLTESKEEVISFLFYLIDKFIYVLTF